MKISSSIVVIGRNEGLRLERCFASLDRIQKATGDFNAEADKIKSSVYVDSGSTDDSPNFARRRAIPVVHLDDPFSAARARNVGFNTASEQNALVEFVQFIDGDCELCPGWIESAVEFLNQTPDCAVVCGVLSERNSHTSIFNRLCQLEWQKTPGPIQASGGIFMIRANAFRQVGGFKEDVVAAEDDELCLRLRQHNWKIYALDKPMAIHDAAMTRFSQWWRRANRAGLAYAHGNYLHGRNERHFSREVRSIWIWGFIVPILAVGLYWWTDGWSLLLLLAYPALILKVFRYGLGRGWSKGDSALYAFFAVLSKFPGVLGMLRFWLRKLFAIHPRIIEHKLQSR